MSSTHLYSIFDRTKLIANRLHSEGIERTPVQVLVRVRAFLDMYDQWGVSVIGVLTLLEDITKNDDFYQMFKSSIKEVF